MSTTTKTGERKDLNFSLCIICQKIKEKHLVEKPASHERVLICIRECASYEYLDYFGSGRNEEGLQPKNSMIKGHMAQTVLQERYPYWDAQASKRKVRKAAGWNE